MESENCPNETDIKFKTLIDNIKNIPVQGYNSKREVVYWNKASEETYGFKQEEAYGKKLEDLIIPDEMKEDVVKGITLWMEEGVPIPSANLILKDKSGNDVNVYSNHIMISDQNGNQQMFCIDICLNELKKKEDELYLNQTFIDAVFTSIQDGIVILDKNLNIKFINPVVSKWYNKCGIIPDTKCYDFFPYTTKSCEECPVKKCMESKKTETTIVEVSKDHTRKEILEIFCYPIINEKNREILGAVKFMRNITKRVLLEKQLLHSQKMDSIGQLAGGIAHDFNNLLTIINGYCELLLDSTSDPGKKEYLENIYKAGLKAGKLTSQLLAFSRKQIAAPEKIKVKKIIQDNIKMIERMLGEDIIIKTDYDCDFDTILFDPVQFEQIIMNLAVNARDAMPKGGRLHIKTENITAQKLVIEDTEINPGEYILIEFQDTGHGMEERTINRAFEPFFTTKEPGKGTGLGLSTVYGIIKQNKGYIFINSEKNKGTVFTILIPLCDCEIILDQDSARFEKDLKGSETILYVEDDESVKNITLSMLRDFGYKVYSVNSPIEAINDFEEKYIDADILITDIVMPEINGKEIADSIKSKNKKIKVLFVSGYTDDKIARHGIIPSGINFLQKPYTRKELAKKIRAVLD
ncbi:MAG: response regulator [Desulfobacteraceae bacterium]|nr:response regulator [Desulfobacteraceae bacterium]